MLLFKYILVLIVVFCFSNTSAHERSLTPFNCHKDYESGDHCHPEWNYDETIYREPAQQEIVLPSASDDEIKEFLKKDKTCREFIKNQWADGVLETCEDMLKTGDIYISQEVKNILIKHTNCFEFTKFKDDYDECDEFVRQGVYTWEELESISKWYKKCNYVSGHLYKDKELCLEYRDQHAIEEKRKTQEAEQKAAQEQNMQVDIKLFELSIETKKKLDRVNRYIWKIYIEEPKRVEDLLVKIHTSKKSISIDDQRYAILNYIEEYLINLITA